MSWDISVLGLTPEEVEAMSPEERRTASIDALNRAADLLQAANKAFDYGTSNAKILQLASELIRIARQDQ